MLELRFVNPLNPAAGASYYGPNYSFTITSILPAGDQGHCFVFDTGKNGGRKECTGLIDLGGRRLRYCEGNLSAEELLATMRKEEHQ